MNARDYAKLPVVALQFLTRIPLAPRMAVTEWHLGMCTAFFPLVGALIAGFIWSWWYACVHLGGATPLFAAAGALAIEAALTGAFHWDGLADTFDGFLSTHKTRDEMLAIMHDSRVGVMGVVAVMSVGMLQLAGLEAVMRWEPADILGALLAMFMLGKWSSTLLSAWAAYSRTEGKGMVFLRHASWRQAAVATATLAPVIAVWPQTVVAAGAVLIFLAIWNRYCTAKVGGVTGDILGATIRLSETMALTAIVAIWA